MVMSTDSTICRGSRGLIAEAAYGFGAAQYVDGFCDLGALFAKNQVQTGPHAVNARWIPGLHI
ncbi:hypothetical protein AQI95_39610 [Streptomyces yokosukanensis]|uniref:Uncharacterized protein n=1 Tax=Streptomyces yokosukanensis TaxID=67386 RepID=A0A124HE22_9ACTN|nr:hypothetical protein AQI95_39610 [Streptomyces yokosukanensis]